MNIQNATELYTLNDQFYIMQISPQFQKKENKRSKERHDDNVSYSRYNREYLYRDRNYV